jgi:reactive intermediate/imine deaminase
MRVAIQTAKAPAAIGSYSQAIKAGDTIYLSGQIGLDAKTGELESDISAQIVQIFDNLQAVTMASGGSLDDVVKLSVFLIDLSNLQLINEIMKNYFKTPFPARTSIQVSALPKAAAVEIDAIMVLG